jgi:general secretion pathway protein C
MNTADLRIPERVIRYAPPVANFILVILIGVALARLVWLIVPTHGGGVIPPSSQSANINTRQASRNPNLAAIKKSHLFGETDPTTPGYRQEHANAPETHLQLTLDGILAWNGSNLSRALIKGAKHKEKTYAVGDKVAGGAKISAIKPDRVVLQRGGDYETLRMKRPEAELDGKTRHPGRPEALTSAIDDDDYSSVRDQLLRHPNKLSHLMRLQPDYKNGQLQGYRIYPGPRRKLFNGLGLHPGDLVTSVNGVRLNNSSKAMTLLPKIKKAKVLNVTLKRNGKTQNLKLNLK